MVEIHSEKIEIHSSGSDDQESTVMQPNSKFRFNFKHVDQVHRTLVHSWLQLPHVAKWFYGQGLCTGQNTFKAH